MTASGGGLDGGAGRGQHRRGGQGGAARYRLPEGGDTGAVALVLAALPEGPAVLLRGAEVVDDEPPRTGCDFDPFLPRGRQRAAVADRRAAALGEAQPYDRVVAGHHPRGVGGPGAPPGAGRA